MKTCHVPETLAGFVPGNFPDITDLAAVVAESPSTTESAHAIVNFTHTALGEGYDKFTRPMDEALADKKGSCISRTAFSTLVAYALPGYQPIPVTSLIAYDATDPQFDKYDTFHAYALLKGPDGETVRLSNHDSVKPASELEENEYGEYWELVTSHIPAASDHNGLIQVRGKDVWMKIFKDEKTREPIQQGVSQVETFYIGPRGIASYLNLYERISAFINARPALLIPGITLPRT